MITKTKLWLIISAVLLTVGVLLFICVMTFHNWDFSKVFTTDLQTKTYEIDENFDSIVLETDTADINFLLSANGKCSVECVESKNSTHSVEVKDGALTVKINEKEFPNIFQFSFTSSKINIYLSETEYSTLIIRESTGDIKVPGDFTFNNTDIDLSTGDVYFSAKVSELLKIKASTGDILLENTEIGKIDISVSTGRITAASVNCENNLNLKVSTGKIYLTDILCKNISSEGSTGDITLNKVIATERFYIERDTGDVKLIDSDASELYIETDTGDVEGNLLTEKIFMAISDTGKIEVPKSVNGGRCEITTDTGDIKISVG